MRQIVTEKFTQNYELAGKLISTGQETPIEENIDGFWGAKASINSKSIKDGSWMGANFSGKILEEVRSELRRDSDYTECLNAQLELTVDYTSPPLPLHQPEASDCVSGDKTDQLIPVANITQRQQTQRQQTRTRKESPLLIWSYEWSFSVSRNTKHQSIQKEQITPDF